MPAYLESAYYRDLASLRRDIRSAVAAGRVEEGEVVDLAVAVARREVHSARGPSLIARIQAARSCVGTVEAELLARAEKDDEAGALAMLVLLEAGRVPGDPLVEKHFQSPSGAWRAVAARGTASARLAPLRRHYYVDPDERTRRSALLAGIEAEDPADLPLLLETARLDPSPANRSLAVRAVSKVGDPQAVLALADVWARADEPLRLAIVEAWGSPALLSKGGAERLVSLAESRQGLVAVSAAASLSVSSDALGARVGQAVLAHFVSEGTLDERVLAIRLGNPGAPLIVAALEKAAGGDDPAVAVVAWARLLEVPAQAARARQALRRVASQGNGAARQAQAALAAAGDESVVPALVRSISDKPAAVRLRAALGLFRLGHAARMASVLADSDPEVRMSVACTLSGGRVQG